MQFAFTDEQELLRSTARKFLSVSPPVFSEPGMNSTTLSWNRAPRATARTARTASEGASSARPRRLCTWGPATEDRKPLYFATMFALNHSFQAASDVARTSSFMM